MDNTHEVDFYTYCATCAHRKKREDETPCDECLNVPARENSRKPLCWKEKEC